MTIISRGTAARGGGSRSTLLTPPKKMANNGHGSPGGGAGEAVDARNQEKSENCEREVAVHAPGGLRQEPEVAVVALSLPPARVKGPPKRWRDACGVEATWPVKKHRSAIAGTCDRGNVFVEANRAAAAATPFPRIQEPAKCGAGENVQKNRPFKDASNRDGVIYTAPSRKKVHRSPGGKAGEAVDERKEEKVGPCVLAVAAHGPHDLRQVSEVAVLGLAVPTRNDQEATKRGCDTNGEEACWLIKKHCQAAAVCEGGNGALDQVNGEVHSMPSPIIEEAVKHRAGENGKNKDWPLKDIPVPAAVDVRNRGIDALANKELDLHVVYKKQATAVCRELKNLPIPEAKATRGKITNQSDCKTKKQPSKSMSTVVGSEDNYISGLSTRLQSLGVTSVTPILAKNVSGSDCSFSQHRLLLSSSTVWDSLLLSMLTPDERRLVYSKDDGLPVEALDRYGCSYDMTLKYLESNNGYRLIGHWGEFLTQNGMCPGDLLELGAFRLDGQFVLTLLHYEKAYEASKEEWISGEKASKEEWTSRETKVSKEEWTSMETEASKEGWTSRETEASKEGWTSRETEARKEGWTSMETVASKEEWTSRETEESKDEWSSREIEASKEEWSSRELEVAEALLMLADFEDDTES